jgi:hypothetical protein
LPACQSLCANLRRKAERWGCPTGRGRTCSFPELEDSDANRLIDIWHQITMSGATHKTTASAEERAANIAATTAAKRCIKNPATAAANEAAASPIGELGENPATAAANRAAAVADWTTCSSTVAKDSDSTEKVKTVYPKYSSQPY